MPKGVSAITERHDFLTENFKTSEFINDISFKVSSVLYSDSSRRILPSDTQFSK